MNYFKLEVSADLIWCSENRIIHVFFSHAGDDAIGVQWTDMNESLNLYASHIDFIQRVATLHNAHW